MVPIYEIIGKLLVLAFLVLLGWIAPKARGWFKASTSKATQDNLQATVRSFARAAEQLYHDTDPSGEARNRFVREQLTALGIEVTEAVLNMIEGAVWEINTETQKAQVQAKVLTTGGGEG